MCENEYSTLQVTARGDALRKDEMGTQIEQILPAGARLFYSESPIEPQNYYAEELALTVRMVASRKAEFFHGRECARAALAQLGVPALAISRGEGREPIWPQGVVGSIAHTESTAIAVVAKSCDIVGIGVDSESAEPLKAELVSLICNDGEDANENRDKAKLLFSIKEAIYKCIYPELQRYVDFLEVSVGLEADGISFVAKPACSAVDLDILKRLKGKYVVTRDTIFSVAWLED